MNNKKIDSYYEPSWKTSKIGDSIYATKFYVMQKQIDELQQENKQLKEQLEASEKARKEAIELLEKHLEAKSYGNHKYELFSREYLEELLKILYVDKGEQR